MSLFLRKKYPFRKITNIGTNFMLPLVISIDLPNIPVSANNALFKKSLFSDYLLNLCGEYSRTGYRIFKYSASKKKKRNFFPPTFRHEDK